MRSYEFRAYWGDVKEFLYFELDSTDKSLLANDNFDGVNLIWQNGAVVSLDDVTIQQYTGLKDRNHNKIYEGDFIKVNGIIWRVFFQSGGFSYGYDSANLMLNHRKCVIVGNIHLGTK